MVSVELLRRSPSSSLRACFTLGQVYEPLARELFNISFVCAWCGLNDSYQEQLVSALESALGAPDIPPNILQVALPCCLLLRLLPVSRCCVARMRLHKRARRSAFSAS